MSGQDFQRIRGQASRAARALEADDAKALGEAGAEGLWAADAELAERWRGSTTLSSGALSGLAHRAIELDAGDCLAQLLASPAWLAGHCPSGDAGSLLDGVVQAVVGKEAIKCARSLCAVSEEFAWGIAAKSAPKYESQEDPSEGRPHRYDQKKAWMQGGSMALEKALGRRGPVSASAREKATEALVGYIRGGWGKPNEEGARDLVGAGIEGAKNMLARCGPNAELASALVYGAGKSGAWQDQAWEAAQELDLGGVEHLRRPLSAGMGFAQGRSRLSVSYKDENTAPVCVFGERVDPCWALAARAKTKADAARAASVLKAWGAREKDRPRMEAELDGQDHPLAKLWDVWAHSKKAGFVLPKAPMEIARKSLEKGLKRFETLVSPDVVGRWRASGEAMLAALSFGLVPNEFAGCEERPRVDRSLNDLSQELAPLAWRVARARGRLNEDEFIACALAQSALGYELDASLRQSVVASEGGYVDPSWVAKAQKALLELSVQDAVAGRSAQLRM